MDTRLSEHIQQANKHARTYKDRWILRLQNVGLKPAVIQLEITTEGSWREDEAWWIAYMKGLGARLVNLTAGGDGLVGYKHSLAVRQKIGDIQRGKSQRPEIVLKRAASNTGRKRSEKTKELISKALKGHRNYPKTADGIENIRKAHLGKVLSEEHKQTLRTLKSRPVTLKDIVFTSQKEAAEAFGVPETSLSRWLRAERTKK